MFFSSRSKSDWNRAGFQYSWQFSSSQTKMEPGPDEDEVLLLQVLQSAAGANRTAVLETELLAALEALESEVEGAEPEHKRVCRNAFPRPTAEDYDSSTWSTLYLQDTRVADESSEIAKQFRTGFRVPWVVYEQLYRIAVDDLGYTESTCDNSGRSVPPLKLKVTWPACCL